MGQIINYVTVRSDGWTAEVPAILLEDGRTLEFAAGNRRALAEDDRLAVAAQWQVDDFKAMRRQSL